MTAGINNNYTFRGKFWEGFWEKNLSARGTETDRVKLRHSMCTQDTVWPFYEVFKEDSVGVALPADADCLQDPCGAKLGQNSVSREPQGLALIVGLNATHEVGLSDHHFGEQIHQRILAGRKTNRTWEMKLHSPGLAVAFRTVGDLWSIHGWLGKNMKLTTGDCNVSSPYRCLKVEIDPYTSGAKAVSLYDGNPSKNMF